MGERGRSRLPLVLGAAALVIVLAGAVLLFRHFQAFPEGPRAVVWDKEPCAECQMAVSDHGFAAQLQAGDGRVLDFDDPGCLFTYLAKESPQVHAIYFRHHREDRWIPSDRAAFVAVPQTPMDYGLGAVDSGTAGALSLAQAQARVAEVNAARGGR